MEKSVIELYLWPEGRNLSRKEVYPTRVFDNEDTDTMLKTPEAITILKEIDHSVYLGNNAVQNELLGVQPVEFISGGVKTLLMSMKYRDLIFPINMCGDNCSHGFYLSGVGAPTKWLWMGYTPELLPNQIVVLPELNIETTGKDIKRVMVYEIPEELTLTGRFKKAKEGNDATARC